MAKWELPANVQEKKKLAIEHVYSHHLRQLGDADGPVFYISDRYAGIWLEHVYDAVSWAAYSGEVNIARNHIGMFFKHQKEDGQLPMAYTFKDGPGYGQIQENVSVGRLCLEVYQMEGDRAFLEEAYTRLCRWDEWLVHNRMPHGHGLIECYCGYDTGHDNSGRWLGVKYQGKVQDPGQEPDAARLPEGCPVLPGIAPDMNAAFYGDRVALGEMAELLGRPEEAAAWREKAETVRELIFKYCYDEQDEFFYDVDKNGNKRRCRTVAITNVLCEGVTDIELGRKIFYRWLWNEKEFKTPYPFPAVSIADPTWHRNLSGNSWGYYSQAMTVLRTTRWMKRYGLTEEMREVMQIWVKLICENETVPFGQEVYPLTGKPSDASPWFSATVMMFLLAVKELEEANAER